MHVTKLEVDLMKDGIVGIHDLIIEKSGGQKGIHDIGGLEHAIFSILSIDNKYERPLYVAAKVYYMLATRHYFFDGNKRTAHITAKTLLYLFSGRHLKVHYKQSVGFIISIADKKRTIKTIEEWIRTNSETGSRTLITDLESELKEMEEIG